MGGGGGRGGKRRGGAEALYQSLHVVPYEVMNSAVACAAVGAHETAAVAAEGRGGGSLTPPTLSVVPCGGCGCGGGDVVRSGDGAGLGGGCGGLGVGVWVRGWVGSVLDA